MAIRPQKPKKNFFIFLNKNIIGDPPASQRNPMLRRDDVGIAPYISTVFKKK